MEVSCEANENAAPRSIRELKVQGDEVGQAAVRSTCGPIYPYSGRDCVKSLRSSYTGLYPQTAPDPPQASLIREHVFFFQKAV